MLNDIHSLNAFPAIDAWYGNIGAHGFVLFYFFPHAFRSASFVSLAFDWLVKARVIMRLHVQIVEHIVAAHRVIPAFKLHFRKFLFDFLLHAHEFGVLTLHRAHSGLVMELF